MPYKIEGNVSEQSRVLILSESDFSIENSTVESGTYEIEGLSSGRKLVVARSNSGQAAGYGYVDPTYYNITPTDGIWYSNTATPLTQVLNIGMTGLINGNYVDPVGTNWNYHGSYGVDLGKEATINGLNIFCWCTFGDPTNWYTANHDSVEVYKSNDNANWTLVQRFDGPPIFFHATQRFDFRLTFNSAQTARYFTVWNAESSSFLAASGGVVLRASEIEIIV